MSKTAQQTSEQQTGGPFSKLNRMEDVEEDWSQKKKMKLEMNSSHQAKSPPADNGKLERITTNNYINEED